MKPSIQFTNPRLFALGKLIGTSLAVLVLSFFGGVGFGLGLRLLKAAGLLP